MAYVIGIDPGSKILGYAVLEPLATGVRYVESGIIKPPQTTLAERLLALGQDLEALFQEYPPEWLSLEKIFLGKNPQSAFVLGHVRGLVLYCAGRAGAQVQEYAPKSMKKRVTGYGDAAKPQVQRALMALLQLRGAISLDASDALGLAFCLGVDRALWSVAPPEKREWM